MPTLIIHLATCLSSAANMSSLIHGDFLRKVTSTCKHYSFSGNLCGKKIIMMKWVIPDAFFSCLSQNLGTIFPSISVCVFCKMRSDETKFGKFFTSNEHAFSVHQYCMVSDWIFIFNPFPPRGSPFTSKIIWR